MFKEISFIAQAMLYAGESESSYHYFQFL